MKPARNYITSVHHDDHHDHDDDHDDAQPGSGQGRHDDHVSVHHDDGGSGAVTGAADPPPSKAPERRLLAPCNPSTSRACTRAAMS